MKDSRISMRAASAVLCMLVCALIYSVAFEGTTFAWFAHRIDVAVDEGSFQMAGMSLDEGEHGKKKILNFTQGTLEMQEDLLSRLRVRVSDDKDYVFESWFLEHKRFIFADNLNAVDTVARHSLLVSTYSIKNTSDIAVYLKFEKPTGTLSQSGKVMTAALWASEDGAYKPLRSAQDFNHYFIDSSIAPDTEITIVFAAFVLENSTGSGFDVSPRFAHAIQATNNAVYFHEDWSPISEYLN